MAQFYPNEGCLSQAAAVQTALVDSKLRLFKQGFVPSVSSKLADFVAEECDFTGYTAGGATIAAWLAPLYNPAGGASIDSPTVQFAAAAPYTIGNVVGGWFLVADEATVVYACGTFQSGVPIGAAGQGVPLTITLVFAPGQ